MEKQRAVPKGFMTVGEVAKKMNVTVRTLQHYDREGLLSPSPSVKEVEGSIPIKMRSVCIRFYL